jgi:hypothetical protein
MDDLGVPLFQETSKCVCVCIFIYIYTHRILGVYIYIYCVCVLWIYEVHSVVLFVCASISLFIFVFMYLFLILMHIDWQFQCILTEIYVYKCILTEHIFENHINHQPHQLYRMLGTQFWPIISSIFACEAPSGRVNHTKYGKQPLDQHTFLYPHDISMLDG